MRSVERLRVVHDKHKRAIGSKQAMTHSTFVLTQNMTRSHR